MAQLVFDTPQDQPQRKLVFDQGAAPSTPPSVAVDMAKSFATGAALRQPASVLGAPRDVAGLITGPMMDGVLSVGNQVRSLLGLEPTVPTTEQRQGMRDVGSFMSSNALQLGHKAIGAIPDVGGGSADIQRQVEQNITGEWHKPQTTAGKFAQTVGEFALPGGLPSAAVRNAPTTALKVGGYISDLLGGVVLPGVASEGAGQLTEGTPLEVPARILGAAAGNAGFAVGRAMNSPDMSVRRATSGTTPEQWDAAAAAQRGNRTGIQVSGPEYLSQATGGASPVTDLLRVVEGSVDGRARSGPFFAARPGQVDDAVGQWLNSISPQSPNPSQLGAKAASAAGRAIEQTPEGQALQDAIFGTGPRTTPMQAGQEIQQPLRSIFDRRDGMRDAIGDVEYKAARAAPARIQTEGLAPEAVAAERPVYSIKPTPADEATGAAPGMQPVRVDKPPQPVAMESLTGPAAIQVDPRPFMRHIDEALVHEKGTTADTLAGIRQGVMGPNGVDTSVTGLDNLRGAMNAQITAAKQAGDGHTAEALLAAQKQLDSVLESVPEYARAREGYQAASAPLAPFQNPAVGRVIERDVHNRNFTTAPENVPGALESGGPSAAAAFNEVAPANARMAYENYLSTKIMDSATDANGAVNPDRLALALRDNQDLLSQYPAVAERLASVPRADQGLAGVRASPLGDVANAKTTEAAGAALLPETPRSGGAAEYGDAAGRVAAVDQGAASGVVRQNLAARYDRASTATMGGNREFGGAKFQKNVAGNQSERDTLDAVLGALGVQPAGPSTSELLDILQTTGRRRQMGSMTEPNRQIADTLSTPGALGTGLNAATTGGYSWIMQARDAARRNALRGNIESLADMFLDPNSVEIMRNAANRGLKVNTPEALARTGGQLAPLFNRDR